MYVDWQGSMVVPLGLRSICVTRRTPVNPWDTACPSCAGAMLDYLMFSLVRALPSACSAAPACCSFALFTGFIGTSARSDSSPLFVLGLRPWPFPAGLPSL